MNAQEAGEHWRTELDRDVSSLVEEIRERVRVIDGIQAKIEAFDRRIAALESNLTSNDIERIRLLRDSRVRLDELNSALKTNAEQALGVIEAYSKQLAELLEHAD